MKDESPSWFTIVLTILQYRWKGEHMTDGRTRALIKSGMTVSIVLKKDQKTGTLTKGVVKNLLTKSPTHPHGIKVRLENGLVGRVKIIHDSNVWYGKVNRLYPPWFWKIDLSPSVNFQSIFFSVAILVAVRIMSN
jgi:uncharacterized repeat protein (TIGR03833 family)